MKPETFQLVMKLGMTFIIAFTLGAIIEHVSPKAEAARNCYETHCK